MWITVRLLYLANFVRSLKGQYAVVLVLVPYRGLKRPLSVASLSCLSQYGFCLWMIGCNCLFNCFYGQSYLINIYIYIYVLIKYINFSVTTLRFLFFLVEKKQLWDQVCYFSFNCNLHLITKEKRLELLSTNKNFATQPTSLYIINV